MIDTYLYRYGHELQRGVLRYRDKRFLVYCALDTGEEIVGYCPNPGSMKGGLTDEGRRVWLSPVVAKGSKLKWRLEIVELSDGVMVGVHPLLVNKVVEEALLKRLIPELGEYVSFRREVKYGSGSRIDFLLDYGEGKSSTYVEVKSVSMSRGKVVEGHGLLAEFPDARTTRGLKHLFELEKVVGSGDRGVMIYVVQRDDCDCVGIAGDIDSDYERKMEELLKDIGSDFFEIICYSCRLGILGIEWGSSLPFIYGLGDR